MKKVLSVLAGAVLLLLVCAGPASAHVVTTVSEAPAGGFVAVGFRIGHGCEGEGGDTEKVEIQMPDGVESATPEAIPGWEATVDDSGPVVVTFEGGPLPTHEYLDFGVSFQAPDTPGETVEFPTIQTCESGEEIAWIESTPEGGEEPESPAPTLTITESEGHSHGGGEEAEGEGDEHAEEAAAAETTSSEDEGDSDTLAIIALVVGALGLLSGGYAVLSSRRAS